MNDKIRKLQHIRLIEEQKISNFATFLKISECGKEWYNNNSAIIEKSINILKEKFYPSLKIKKKEYNIINENTSYILSELKNWRNKISTKKNIPTYCVLQNKTLESISKVLPKNLDELEKIKGIGKIVLNQYGSDLINLLSEIQV